MTETYARADGMEPMPDLAELLFDGEPIPLATGRPLSPFPTEALPQIVKNMEIGRAHV